MLFENMPAEPESDPSELPIVIVLALPVCMILPHRYLEMADVIGTKTLILVKPPCAIARFLSQYCDWDLLGIFYAPVLD